MDVKTGEVIEFYHEALEEMKRKVAEEMGYELVDHRLSFWAQEKITQALFLKHLFFEMLSLKNQ